MHNLKPRLWLHIFIVIALGSMLTGGCEEEVTTPIESATPSPTLEQSPTTTPSPASSPTDSSTLDSDFPDEPPKLPPSFGFDADVFGSLPDTAPSSDTLAQGAVLASILPTNQNELAVPLAWGDQSYWMHASSIVLIWSAIIVVGLAIPVAAFVAAFDNIPYREDSNTWIWSYDVKVKMQKYSAELHGSYIENGVEWEMYISKKPEYTDFLWYYGESDLAGTDGYWIMKENPKSPNDLLRIDWSREPEKGKSNIKYENIKPGAPENGGYILTSVTNESPYGSHWEIYNKGEGNYTYIEWNTETEAGRVKDTKRFGDTEWHCWGSDHKNLDKCP